MIKWIGLILSFVMGRFNSHPSQPSFNLKDAAMGIFDDVTYKSRNAVSLLLVALASVIFICGGFFICLIDATRQYDTQGTLVLTSTLISGAALSLIAIAVFAWVFTSAWPGVKANKMSLKEKAEQVANRAVPPQASTIESAVSALIMDFVHERERNREHRPPPPSHHSAPPPPRPPHREHDRDPAFDEPIPPVYPH